MNITMKKYYLLGVLILLLASCIDDKSDLGLNLKLNLKKTPIVVINGLNLNWKPRKLNKLIRINRLAIVGKSTIRKYLKKKT